mmetsp:Transcript_11536/g.33978  ORF Transcript_11536/g.33978 Transcript_11536/m.33978 type:complete len:225 (-) Transcript_11536:4732-5406(-)
MAVLCSCSNDIIPFNKTWDQTQFTVVSQTVYTISHPNHASLSTWFAKLRNSRQLAPRAASCASQSPSLFLARILETFKTVPKPLPVASPPMYKKWSLSWGFTSMTVGVDPEKKDSRVQASCHRKEVNGKLSLTSCSSATYLASIAPSITACSSTLPIFHRSSSRYSCQDSSTLKTLLRQHLRSVCTSLMLMPRPPIHCRGTAAINSALLGWSKIHQSPVIALVD